jgi:hypothetical protein
MKNCKEHQNHVKKEMTVLEMLREIEEKKCIYNIHYCKAGVGFIFYEGGAEFTENWRDELVVDRYYPTFEEAVKGEWERVCRLPEDGK